MQALLFGDQIKVGNDILAYKPESTIDNADLWNANLQQAHIKR